MKSFRLLRENLNGIANIQVVNKDHLAKFDPKPGLKFPTDKKIPAMLLFKRKAIRVYPDNQKVALYYSEQLNQYITIPFGGQIQVNESTKLLPQSREEKQRDMIKRIRDKQKSNSRTKAPKEKEVKSPYTDPVPGGWEGVGDLGARGVGLAGKAVIGTAKVAGAFTKGAVTGFKDGLSKELAKAPKAKPRIRVKAKSQIQTVNEVNIAGAVRGAIKKGKEALKNTAKNVKDKVAKATSGDAGSNSSSDMGLGPIKAKDVSFRGNAIVQKSRPERQTAQGGTTSPTQEVQYRNALMKQSLREQTVIDIAKSHNLTISGKLPARIVALYESLNVENKNKLFGMLNEDAASFKKVIEFTDKVSQ